MAKKLKKCQADGCNKVLNSYNKTGFCSRHIDGPAKKVYVGFSWGKEPEACFCWWNDRDFIKEDYDACIELMITGNQYVKIKKIAASLDRLDPFPGLGSSFLSNDIPTLFMVALKKTGKI